MALSNYDADLLTSVYGIGQEEAAHFCSVMNSILAAEIPTKTYLFRRALNQMIAAGAMGASEANTIEFIVDAFIAETPDSAYEPAARRILGRCMYDQLRKDEQAALAAAMVGA